MSRYTCHQDTLYMMCTQVYLGMRLGIPLTEYVSNISRYTCHRICPNICITCDVIVLG